MGKFTAPMGGDSKRIENVELIPTGFQLCTLYGLTDIGTQDGGNYGPRHKVNLCFEFPLHMRVFYEGDDPKPAAVFVFETLSMHPDSNLRKKFIEPMNGGSKFSDKEAEEFDISALLGKHFIATIAHSPDGKWANIQSITPLTQQNKGLFQLADTVVAQINPSHFFHLDDGFDSPNFASLPKFLRETLMSSEEGRAFKAAGGTFAEAINDYASGTATVGAKKLEMVDLSVTEKAYYDAGWTAEQLVSSGKAKWVTPTPPPVPVTTAAAPPPPVVAPPPAVAPPPVAEKKLVMKDPTHILADWIAQGWTEETLIANGYATFQ